MESKRGGDIQKFIEMVYFMKSLQEWKFVVGPVPPVNQKIEDNNIYGNRNNRVYGRKPNVFCDVQIQQGK